MQQTAGKVKWVTDKFLADYFSVSRVTIWRWVREGKIPPPKKISANTSRWDFEKVLEILEA